MTINFVKGLLFVIIKEIKKKKEITVQSSTSYFNVKPTILICDLILRIHVGSVNSRSSQLLEFDLAKDFDKDYDGFYTEEMQMRCRAIIKPRLDSNRGDLTH